MSDQDGRESGSETESGPGVNAEVAGKAVQGVGCLVLVALVVFFGLWVMFRSATGQDPGSKVETWWDSQTAVSQAAYCGSVQRDPSFNGGAIGMADAIGDTSVDQYDTKKFLLDVCFPQ